MLATVPVAHQSVNRRIARELAALEVDLPLRRSVHLGVRYPERLCIAGMGSTLKRTLT